MLYAIIATDRNESLSLRQATRTEHLARLSALQDQGRLLLAGPHPAIDNNEPGTAGFTGSLIVAEFTSLQEAREWADNDPYRVAGVYEHITVKPFKKVFPK